LFALKIRNFLVITPVTELNPPRKKGMKKMIVNNKMGCGRVRSLVNLGARMWLLFELSHKLYPSQEIPEAKPPNQKAIPFLRLSGKAMNRLIGTKIHQGSHSGTTEFKIRQPRK
jgi:hypothetical protein